MHLPWSNESTLHIPTGSYFHWSIPISIHSWFSYQYGFSSKPKWTSGWVFVGFKCSHWLAHTHSQMDPYFYPYVDGFFLSLRWVLQKNMMWFDSSGLQFRISKLFIRRLFSHISVCLRIGSQNQHVIVSNFLHIFTSHVFSHGKHWVINPMIRGSPRIWRKATCWAWKSWVFCWSSAWGNKGWMIKTWLAMGVSSSSWRYPKTDGFCGENPIWMIWGHPYDSGNLLKCLWNSRKLRTSWWSFHDFSTRSNHIA